MKNEELYLDLLGKKALEGLNDEEQEQLDELMLASGMVDDSYELAAAAISMVDLKTNEPLPAHLRARILADGERFIHLSKEPDRQISYTEPKASWWNWNWLGWAAAAAACILLALNVWLTRVQTPPPDVAENPPVKEELSPSQLRRQMIDSGAEMVRAEWSAGNMKDAKGLSGDIVWSDAKQAGYMRFRGLPVNDRNKETYQLWIYDETQDKKTPIDGGTFDIQADGDVIIPVNAKLKALKPKMFAVTVEKPGGVVVSKGEKVAALAKVET